jgi:cobalt-zinc-cadmium efflux system membrane fusion protein
MNKIFLILATTFLMVCVGCKSKSEEPETTGLNPEFLKEVQTEKAVLSNQKETLRLTGKVESNPERTIHYIPLVSGRVEQVMVSLGDRVQQGQTLLTLRSAELSELNSELISARAELRIAQREYLSAKALFDDKMLSERELFEAEAAVTQAQAEIERIENTLSIHGVSDQRGIFTIKSPISGYILERNVSAGSNISDDGDEIFTIADLSTVWIIANVHAGDLMFVKENMPVEITTHAYPGEVFHGKINAMSRVFDPEERVLKARIVMPNKDLQFKPEMFVDVKLKSETNRLAVAIPSEALIFDNNRHFVVVENADGTFENREVVVQGQHEGVAYITTGLKEGEEVVVKNQLLIYTELK